MRCGRGILTFNFVGSHEHSDFSQKSRFRENVAADRKLTHCQDSIGANTMDRKRANFNRSTATILSPNQRAPVAAHQRRLALHPITAAWHSNWPDLEIPHRNPNAVIS
jgi:hypothetical protein